MEEMSNVMMIISGHGRCFLIDQGTNEVWWSYMMNDGAKMHQLRQRNMSPGYIDAAINDGEITLYHHKNDRPKPKPLSWTSDKQIKEYLFPFFGTNNTESSERIAYLDQYGEEIVDGSSPACWYQINRRNFQVHTSWWDLEFSQYQAFYWYDNRSFSIHVYHTFDMDDFQKICLIHNVRDTKEIKSHIWIHTVTPQNIQLTDTCLDERHNVRKGKLGGFHVAVKIFPKTYVYTTTCMKLWKSNYGANIRKFFGVQVHNDSYHVALEYCTYTLHDYLRIVQEEDVVRSVIRGIVDGIKYLHLSKRVCHMKLNPWNILITSDGVAKISGFANCVELTDDGVDQVLYDLGNLMVYFHMPRDDCPASEEMYNHWTENMNHVKLQGMKPEAKVAYDIAERMFSGRVTFDQLLVHMFFYDTEKQMSYANDAIGFVKANHERLKLNDPKINIISEIDKTNRDVFNDNDWSTSIPLQILICSDPGYYLSPSKPKYQRYLVFHLLKFVRNLTTHHFERKAELDALLDDGELSEQEHKECMSFLGLSKESTAKKFHELFPNLLMRVYRTIEDRVPQGDRSTLASYYIQ